MSFVTLDPSRPVTLNILLPAIVPFLTAGSRHVLHFAVEMERFGVHCRFLHDISCRSHFFDNITYYARQDDDEAQSRVEFLSGSLCPGLHCHPDDRFMACRADSVAMLAPFQQAVNDRLLFYFIQDDERLHPEAHGGLVAAASYEHPHIALFSTAMLAQFFRDHHIGVFREEAKSKLFWIFQPAVELPDPETLGSWKTLADSVQAKQKKKMVVYWRPAQKRNMANAIVQALSELGNEGTLVPEEWEILGLGANTGSVALGTSGLKLSGIVVDHDTYIYHLRTAVVAIALAETPHPSVAPFDFVASGSFCVTNTYGAQKTSSKLSAISDHFVVCDDSASAPSLKASIVRACEKAAQAFVDNPPRRHVLNWASRWDDDRCYGPAAAQFVSEQILQSSRWSLATQTFLTRNLSRQAVFDGWGEYYFKFRDYLVPLKQRIADPRTGHCCIVCPENVETGVSAFFGNEVQIRFLRPRDLKQDAGSYQKKVDLWMVDRDHVTPETVFTSLRNRGLLWDESRQSVDVICKKETRAAHACAFIVPLLEPTRGFDRHVSNFIDSYSKHPAGWAHEFIAVFKCNRFSGREDDEFEDLPTEDQTWLTQQPAFLAVRKQWPNFIPFFTSNVGFGEKSYADVGKHPRFSDFRGFTFITTYTLLQTDQWLQKILHVLKPEDLENRDRVGVVSASGSWAVGGPGSYPNGVVKHTFPNPHFRSDFWSISRNTFQKLKWPYSLCTKWGTCQLEHGYQSMTQQLHAAGLKCLVIGASGANYSPHQWLHKNGYLDGDHSEMMACDTHGREAADSTCCNINKCFGGGSTLPILGPYL